MLVILTSELEDNGEECLYLLDLNSSKSFIENLAKFYFQKSDWDIFETGRTLIIEHNVLSMSINAASQELGQL